MINWYKLSVKHKKYYFLNKALVMLAIMIAGLVALKIEKLDFPSLSNKAKLEATAGFIMVSIVVVLGLFNRIGTIFKVKSFGFVVFFLMFLFLDLIIAPLKMALGLMLIPMLIDDIIIVPIWKSIWYNNYE